MDTDDSNSCALQANMNLFIYLFIIQNVRNNYDIYLFIPFKVDFLRQTKENAICGLQPATVLCLCHLFTLFYN